MPHTRITQFCFCLLGLLLSQASWAAEGGVVGGSTALPTVDEVVARYVVALGGPAAVQKLTRRVIVGEAESSLFAGKARWEYVACAPDKRVSTLDVPKLGAIVDGFDGAVAWRKSADLPPVTLSGEELAKARRDAQFHRDSNLKVIYPDLTIQGVEQVGGEACYLAVAKPSAGAVERFFFSQKSGLLLRQDSEFNTASGRVISSATYDDYRTVDGVRIPFVMRVKAGGAGTGGKDVSFIMRFREVRHNVPVDESRFNPPKP
jgi:hypothetical protein